MARLSARVREFIGVRHQSDHATSDLPYCNVLPSTAENRDEPGVKRLCHAGFAQATRHGIQATSLPETLLRNAALRRCARNSCQPLARMRYQTPIDMTPMMKESGALRHQPDQESGQSQRRDGRFHTTPSTKTMGTMTLAATARSLTRRREPPASDSIECRPVQTQRTAALMQLNVRRPARRITAIAAEPSPALPCAGTRGIHRAGASR